LNSNNQLMPIKAMIGGTSLSWTGMQKDKARKRL
jgi:hypothetical protein